MYPIYKDIRERLGTPKWHDRHGVPRYSDFTPDECAEIYCDWAVLMEVKCQACDEVFLCGNACRRHDFDRNNVVIIDDPEVALLRLFGWGDAPWHDQCSGTTMSTDYRIIGFWHKRRTDYVWESLPIPDEYGAWDTE